MIMIPRCGAGLVVVLAGLSGMPAGALGQQAGPQAPVQQAPPQQHQPGTPQSPGAAEQSDAPEPPTRLGRPFPAPVQPPPRKEEPSVYVGIVSPQESGPAKNRQRTPSLRNGGSAPQSGSGTDNALERPAGGSAFGQPVE
jgi:hypothetical protein